MNDMARLLVLVVVAGAAMTLLAGAAAWWGAETRRIRRAIGRVLQGPPEALIVAQGRGRGVGLRLAADRLAVAWDAGGWCLIYRIDELMGAELVADGQVMARVHRGEARRALDMLGGAEHEVRLRLVFDDPAYPDFDLELWTAADAGRRGAASPAEALQEANRWIARVEALLRRPQALRPAAVQPPAAAPQLFDLDDDENEDEDSNVPF
jgi:hypothetical protein